jgi:hypothetical protein
MKTSMLIAAAMGAALLSTSAFAEETIVRERTVTEPGPGVTVGVPGVGVRVGAPDVEHRSTTVTTTGSTDCHSKTVHKEGVEGSTTVRKERCD